jgi:hypothetical protein
MNFWYINNKQANIMLPHEMPDRVPRAITKSVWSITVLKAGLGMTGEPEVRAFFHDNPHMLEPFGRMNRHLEKCINELQNICINELQLYMIKVKTGAFNQPMIDYIPNSNQLSIEDMPDLNQPKIEDMEEEEL